MERYERFGRAAHPLRGVLLCILALTLVLPATALAQEPELLDARDHPKFVNPVPNPLDPSFIYQPMASCPATFPADCETCYQVGMYQIQQPLGLEAPDGTPLTTTVWGYGTGPGFPNATYPGRTFEAYRDNKVCVQWTNNLPLPPPGGGDTHILPVDPTLHWAFSLPGYTYDDYLTYGVPVVPHVHGGHTESDSDGLPEYWWTPGEGILGPRFVKSLYEYDNDQEAGTIWYHDHGLGITRLNVYAGLAGFYIIRDDVDTGTRDNPLGLPAFPYEVPLVIQDRLFTTDGQLFYPSEPEEPGQPDPSALPEMFGDFILVNGVPWPVMDVEPRKYRLRFLNGSDSRFYSMWISEGAGMSSSMGPTIWQIGTDVALLEAPVPLDQLTLGPGERADTIVDFASFAGHTLILKNNARSPFPKGDTLDPQTAGQLMAFRVSADPVDDPSVIPPVLRPPINPLVQDGATRELVLFEGEDEFGRLKPLLGTVADGALEWAYPITENPMLDDVEVWEIYNATEDAHPIHLHLVVFQVIERQKYKAHVNEDGSLSRIRVIGKPKKPSDEEAGWKDTVKMYPGEVTRIIAKFDRPGRYVWHCHILSHEDHEMMRPYCVGQMGVDCIDP